jgi:ligand-binding sensor domain-containing protein
MNIVAMVKMKSTLRLFSFFKNSLLFVVLFCLLPFHSQAQLPVFGYEKLSTELERVDKGLSQNSIRTMLQDKHGFLWFGTWAGLNRYDGQNIVILGTDIDNLDGSLSSPVINAIAEDNSGYLWVGTEGGINKVNRQTLEIENFQKSAYIHPDLKDTIFSLLADSSILWVGTQKKLIKVDLKDDSLYSVPVPNPEGITNLQIRTIKKQGVNTLVLGTDDGLLLLNTKSLEIMMHLRFPKLSSSWVLCAEKISEKQWFVGTENGLNLVDITSGQVQNILLDADSDKEQKEIITDVMLDRDSNLWIASSGHGIRIMAHWKDQDYSTEKLSALPLHSERFPGKLGDEDYYYSLLQSHDGTLWLGSAWSGAFKLVNETNIFQKFQKNSASQGMSDNRIWAFLDNQEELWIGTEKGVNIYNRKNHSLRVLNHIGPKNKRLSSEKIRSLYKDSQGHIWVGTFQNGLNKYNPKTKHVEVFSPDSSLAYYIASNTIWRILEDDKHNLWFATHNGLQKINLLTGETKVYRYNADDSTSISSNVVYNIYIDRQGRLWAATFNGLNMFLSEKNHFKRFTSESGNPKSLNTNRIFSVYQDTSLNYWVGTIGGGLNKLDPVTGEVSHFTTTQGLSDNTIYAIIPDEYGNLWLPTNYGISAFNLKNESFVSYTVDDGLTSNEFNIGAAMKDQYGNLYFGGMFGFNVLIPRKIRTSNLIPEIRVTEYSIDNQIQAYVLLDGEKISLNHHQKSVDLKFTALDFINPYKTTFKYRLKNVDKQWRTMPSRYAQINFNKLSPGNYTLEVIAMNSVGVWTEKPFLLQIEVKEAWYNLIIFRIILVFIILMFVFLIIHRRLNQIRLKHKTERQLLDLEKQTLRLQMNPHFIFNTLNSIQNFILKNDTDKSIGYLSKFSKLMRMMLNFSRKQYISLDEELRLIQSYLDLERLRLENSFEWSMHTSADMDLEEIGIPPMIIQPFVENAIIHGLLPLKGRKGDLHLNFEMKEENILCVSIKDNGVGRSFKETKRDKHRPSGMLITKKRLELINKLPQQDSFYEVVDLKDNMGKGMGTIVNLKIQIAETEN